MTHGINKEAESVRAGGQRHSDADVSVRRQARVYVKCDEQKRRGDCKFPRTPPAPPQGDAGHDEHKTDERADGSGPERLHLTPLNAHDIQLLQCAKAERQRNERGRHNDQHATSLLTRIDYIVGRYSQLQLEPASRSCQANGLTSVLGVSISLYDIAASIPWFMTPRHSLASPAAHLPLTPATFHILLSLSEGERHGYAIMREVAERTRGAVKLGPGTLYTALKRLVDSGVVLEAGERPDRDDDERRRYYRLTPLGRAVARAEARRLDEMVRLARSKRLIGAQPA
jgi:DNA-binding PadR family transcriptional regulator